MQDEGILTTGTAVILGIVEGLTEFIPVSSTGHLILTSRLLGLDGPAVDTFDVFIQLGAILGVVVLYFNRFVGLVYPRGSDGRFSGSRGIALLITTSLPAALLGALMHGVIKERLFNPASVAFALAIGAVLMIWVERRSTKPVTETIDELTYRQAFLIGVCQCVSLWPGFSRSASTICGGMLGGCSRAVAAQYSFLAAVPIMLAAVSYDLYKNWAHLSADNAQPFLVGFIVAFISAIVAVRTFLSFVSRHRLSVFAWYRLALAVAVILVMGGF